MIRLLSEADNLLKTGWLQSDERKKTLSERFEVKLPHLEAVTPIVVLKFSSYVLRAFRCTLLASGY